MKWTCIQRRLGRVETRLTRHLRLARTALTAKVRVPDFLIVTVLGAKGIRLEVGIGRVAKLFDVLCPA